jgi:hypothetical protein
MRQLLRHVIRRPALAVLAPAAALLVAGCGAASSSAGQQVASIPVAPPASSAAGGPARSGTTAPASLVTTPPASGGTGSAATGPVERLDDTPQQINALIVAWNNCLVAHGATYGTVAGVAGSRNLSNIPSSAKAACLSKEPQLPPQLNPSENPQYRTDSIANVACLRAHGVMVHLVSDTSVFSGGLSWTYDSDVTSSPDNLSQLQQTCQLQAFGGKH